MRYEKAREALPSKEADMESDAASKLPSKGESGEGAHLLPGPRGANGMRNVAMLVGWRPS